jgi:hypothetical protein
MLITPGILASADALRYLTKEVEAEALGVVLWVLDFVCQAVAASPTPAVTRMELIRVLAPVLAAGGLTALLRAGGRSQFETAVDLERATANHMACWVTVSVGRYQRPDSVSVTPHSSHPYIFLSVCSINHNNIAFPSRT